MWYGVENDLTAWYALCRAIGVEPLPKTCEQCEEVGDRVTKFGRFILTGLYRLYGGYTLTLSI
jgi:hypothetical protein